MKEPEVLDEKLKRMALILGWMLIGAGSIWALTHVWPFIGWSLQVVSPFLIALVVAYLFNPIVNVVQVKLKLGRIAGMLCVAALILLMIFTVFGILIPKLYQQGSHLVGAVSASIETLLHEEIIVDASEDESARGPLIPDMQSMKLMARDVLEFCKRFLEEQNLNYKDVAAKATPAIGQGVKASAGLLGGLAGGVMQIAKRALFFLGGLANAMSVFVMVLIITCYYLLEFHKIPGLVAEMLPISIEERTMDILGKVDKAVGGFLRGQVIVCSLVATIATVGLFSIGMWQYALLVGVLAGVANLVPYLGPVMGALPAVIWALFAAGHETMDQKIIYSGLVIGLFILIQTLDGFVFQPRIVGKNSNLHPLIVMLALIVGAQFGLAGMIVAVPLSCIARVLFLELYWNKHIASKRISS